MWGRVILWLSLTVGLVVAAPLAKADISPTLLIESVPSDNPEYRRMIYVKYLRGEQVNVNYRTYTRSEFQQVPNATPGEVISACARGSATSLSEIKSFERAEARRKRSGQPAEAVRFCIKNVSGWESGTRDTYLDPIFNGMPLGPKN